MYEEKSPTSASMLADLLVTSCPAKTDALGMSSRRRKVHVQRRRHMGANGRSKTCRVPFHGIIVKYVVGARVSKGVDEQCLWKLICSELGNFGHDSLLCYYRYVWLCTALMVRFGTMPQVVMENYDGDFADMVQKGDILVAVCVLRRCLGGCGVRFADTTIACVLQPSGWCQHCDHIRDGVCQMYLFHVIFHCSSIYPI